MMRVQECIDKYIPKTGRVLEVGCGSGYFLKNLSENYPEVEFFGVDPYISKLDKPNLHLLPLRAEEIESLPGWFHLIFTIHSLHHFSSPEEFFKQAGKKLSWKGKIIVWDWNFGAKTGIPERYFSTDELLSMAKKTNLEVEVLKNFGDENLLIASAKSIIIAVATDDGHEVFPKMFGRATYFQIYRKTGNKIEFLERRTNIHRDNFQHLKTYDVYKLVQDCNTIITGNIGRKGEERLKNLGVRIIKYRGKIEKILEELSKEGK